MAKSTIRITGSEITWVRPDGSEEFTIDTDTITNPAMRHQLFMYGAKQVIADGGAVGRNVPDEERIGKMEKRARALRDGTWGFRDGHGTPAAVPAWQDQFAALVAVGALPDAADVREAFKSARPTERVAMLAASPEAQAHYDANRPTARIDGSALLARLAAKA
jgi:hypothetical protein